jgi:DNA polymerase III delta prime subunit
MANQEQLSPLITTSIPTAQLWTGHRAELEQLAILYLQKIICPQKSSTGGCALCSECTKIKNRQHSCCVWLVPSNGYTLESIEPIKEITRLMLDPGEQLFFIIPDAQMLFPSAANALLKTIEEPHAGYHFILHAPHSDSVMPTIVSRSIIFQLQTTDLTSRHQVLLDHFSLKKKVEAPHFFKEIETSHITEQESSFLLGQITQSLIQTLENTGEPEIKRQIADQLNILLEQSIYLPKSGGAKLFWKNLFLQSQKGALR